MTIDLEDVVNEPALFTLADGRQGHTYVERGDGTCGMDADKYYLRVESGWYWEYRRDGFRLVAGIIRHRDGSEEVVGADGKGDIVAVRACAWEPGMPAFRP